MIKISQVFSATVAIEHEFIKYEVSIRMISIKKKSFVGGYIFPGSWNLAYYTWIILLGKNSHSTYSMQTFSQRARLTLNDHLKNGQNADTFKITFIIAVLLNDVSIESSIFQEELWEILAYKLSHFLSLTKENVSIHPVRLPSKFMISTRVV